MVLESAKMGIHVFASLLRRWHKRPTISILTVAVQDGQELIFLI